MLDPMALECFLAVVETGSFTRAAEKVARTQSAVSQQIAKLENMIGKPLFRRNKTLSITSDGEVLMAYAVKIMALNHEALDRFKEPELKGNVRFGLPEDFASVFLSEVLIEYKQLHPQIILNIECDLTLHLFERFKQKAFDLVLVKMNRPEDFPNGIDVWSESLVWVGDHKHFKNHSNRFIPLVLSPDPCVYRSRAIQALSNFQSKWHIVFSSHSFASTIAAVRAGMGITVFPRNMVPKDLEVIMPQAGVPDLKDTHISLLKHDDQNASVNSFEAFVIDKLRH